MEIPIPSLNWLVVAPEIVVLVTALLVMGLDLVLDTERKSGLAWVGLVGVVAAAGLSYYIWDGSDPQLQDMLAADGYALFFNLVILAAAALAILFSVEYVRRSGLAQGEYYTLLLLSAMGMMLMAAAINLITIFLALEILSLALYVLVGLNRASRPSAEAGLKYLLLGGFASGFLLYGMALVYGQAGTMSLAGIREYLAGTGSAPALLFAGLGLMIVGFGFKVALVPFQMWTPDVYQGAPTPVTAFMSVGAKAGGFAALLRILVVAMPAVGEAWGMLVAVLAMLTMILGNVVAIAQRNIKRMLAYSSIAHAGYILVAVSAAQRPEDAPLAVSAAVFYLLTYAFTNLGAFGVVLTVEHEDGSGNQIEDFAGLGRSKPLLAAMMTLFMLSLTGMPVSAGLVGKFFVFQAAINASVGNPWVLAAAIVGIVTSVISAFYYIRIILIMYMQEGEPQVVLKPALTVALAVTALATLILGIVPAPVFQMAKDALLTLAG
jgi:NADH-quinone oxidoreductase subunit N